MTKVNLSLPAPLDGFVARQVRENRFHSAEEYVLDLVRRDQRDAEGEETERLLLQGLDSGEAAEMTQADWRGLHAKLDQKHGKRSSCASPDWPVRRSRPAIGANTVRPRASARG